MTSARLTERLFDDSFTGTIDPFAVFEDWLETAREAEINDPTAMALATVDADGMPDVRMVLMNARDERGIVFFTNLGSAKAREIAHNPAAAVVFHWKSARRQVRMRGPLTRVSEAEADAYFATRSRSSQLGAYASRQSEPLESRAALEARAAEVEARHGGDDVSRPEFWSGYRLTPLAVEFWKDGAHRLHDRMQFRRSEPGAAWTRQRLFP